MIAILLSQSNNCNVTNFLSDSFNSSIIVFLIGVK